MHPDRHGGRSLSLAAAEIGPGKVTALHRHPLAEEIYHVVSGMGLLTLGAERIVIEHGDTVCIMPGTEHRVENTGGETLIILCCCTPPYSHDDTEIL
jgi:mannose-6-phosphate isomerase-like protein (cupin superfamily)